MSRLDEMVGARSLKLKYMQNMHKYPLIWKDVEKANKILGLKIKDVDHSLDGVGAKKLGLSQDDYWKLAKKASSFRYARVSTILKDTKDEN